MIGWRRKEKTPSIEEVRELTVEEVREMPRGTLTRIAKLRDSHHTVARLLALGNSIGEVAVQAGYSYNSVSMLAQDPSMQELVAHYREMLNGQFLATVDEYYSGLVAARNKALRRINDKLDDDEADLSISQLHAIHSDAADRTGYPKRKDVVVANVDFADSLDAAITRSRQAKLINGTANPEERAPPSSGSGAGGSDPLSSAPLNPEGVAGHSSSGSPEPDGAGEKAGAGNSPPGHAAMVEPASAPASPRPSIRDLLPPTRQQKALMQRRA